MEIRQLRYFLAVAHTEHLTVAARNLYVTQSTLSHGLRLLEEDLGIQLFERIGRRLKLSEAGAVFRNFAGRALQELEAGRMALSDLSGLQAGVLKVGVIPTFLNTLVPATVAAFNAAYPGISIVVRDLRASPLEEQLVAGELDLGIAFYPTQRREIEAEPLFEERMQLIVNRSHPLAGRSKLAFNALAKVPLALLTPAFATRRLIDQAMRTAGVTPNVPVEMESVEALIAACRDSQLASIVPERAASQATDMRAINLVSPQLVRPAAVLWRQGASRSMAAQSFAALLRKANRGQ
jgi:LysR family cyn operon transcriptional activator